MMNIRVATVYLILQGIGAIAWWIAIAVSPEFRTYFFPADWDDTVWMAFAPPDLLVYVGGSFVAALMLTRRSRHATWVLAMHLGGALYATLFCVGVNVVTGEGGLGTAMMLVSVVIVGSILAGQLRREPE